MHNIQYMSDLRKIKSEKQREKVYFKFLKININYQDTLEMRISYQIKLKDWEIYALQQLLCARCSQETRNRVKQTLEFCPNIRTYGIYSRILFEKDYVHYIAGQSYPDEIRIVRQCLRG